MLGVVAAYMLYTAYQLYQGRTDPNTTMTQTAMILFIILFVLAAIALLVYACRVWKAADREEENKPSGEDENSLK